MSNFSPSLDFSIKKVQTSIHFQMLVNVKILVAVKHVLDYKLKVKIKSDRSDVDLTNLKMSLDPFAEIALEEALRLKEAGKATEVLVVSIGSEAVEETLRAALAMGADKAFRVNASDQLETLNVAKCLKIIVEQEKPQIVFLGKQAIDDDNNQTGQMLAALLDWPQATFASKLELNNDALEVSREVDTGIETLSLTLPAVITADLRLNEPRYPTLPNIMKAKQKTLDIIEPEIELKKHLTLQEVSFPPERKKGEILEDVNALLNKLKNEAKVII